MVLAAHGLEPSIRYPSTFSVIGVIGVIWLARCKGQSLTQLLLQLICFNLQMWLCFLVFGVTRQ
ncbi:hypothetical protein F5Y06DRAFT_273545 [Hypoxylon sp. FL0890]|nr:hypothetical protein F5Y06DRAFT_273545 [Hypoxylon sp. FL0890]